MSIETSNHAFFSNAGALLSPLLSDSDEAFFLVDQNLKIRFYNHTAAKKTREILGQTLTVGTSILSLAVNPARIPFLKKIYASIFRGQVYETEQQVQVNGRPFIYQYHLRPAKDEAGNIAAAIVTVYDVTEKRAVENALKENEERLRFALEGSDHGVWDWNIKTGTVFFSHAWKERFGFKKDGINQIEEWKARVHPDDNEQLDRDVHLHFSGHDMTVYETSYRLRAADGAYRWIVGRGKIIERAADGTPVRMIGTHTDVTEKKKSEEQYRNLFDTNPLSTWIYDFETLRFLAVNKAALHHYGYTKAEFLSMTIFDVHPHEQWPLLNGMLEKRHMEGNLVLCNWKHRKKDGTVFIADVNASNIQYNGKKARLIVVNDITEKVAAQEALKQSHQRFQYVSKATSDAIYDLNIVSGQLDWGEGFTTLFGYAPHEITVAEWEAHIHPEDRDVVITNLSDVMERSRKKLWKAEYRFRKQDGTYRYVVDKGFIIRCPNNTPVRMIGAMQDITNLKQKQLELLDSNKRYEYATLAIADIIWDWDLERDCVLWSDNYEKITGWRLPADKRLPLATCLERFHESVRGRVWESLTHAMNDSNKRVWEAEVKYKKSNGEVADIYNRGYIIRNEAGVALRMIGAMQDVTHRKKLEEQLLQKELDKQKVISKATIDTQEKERTEIGKELHDNVNQVLTTTKLYLELALSDAQLKDELIQKSEKNILYVINEIRQLSRSLMNPSLGDLGLIDSVRDLVENIRATRKLAIVFEAAEAIEDRIPESLHLSIYRIIQEALNNVVKHAAATTVSVFFYAVDEGAALVVQDDGIGFNTAEIKKGAGLKSIQNRIYLTNGQMCLESAPGKGCKLTIHFKT